MTPEEFDIVQRLTAGQGLSKTALAVYQKAQKYFHRVSQGPFEIQTLALLVAIAEVLDEKRLVATTMRVQDDVDRTFDESRVMTVLYQGTFVRAWYCRKGARQRVNVRLDGDRDGETAIPKEHVLSRPRGFAFVEMGSQADADAAVNALNGKDFGGRALTVNEAREQAPRRGGGGGGGDRRGGGRRF